MMTKTAVKKRMMRTTAARMTNVHKIENTMVATANSATEVEATAAAAAAEVLAAETDANSKATRTCAAAAIRSTCPNRSFGRCADRARGSYCALVRASTLPVSAGMAWRWSNYRRRWTKRVPGRAPASAEVAPVPMGWA